LFASWSAAVFLPGLRKIIDVRGCFWQRHTCKDGARTPETNTGYWVPKIERNVARDRENVEEWKRQGWEQKIPALSRAIYT
jgi:DNA mismatch endonuclease (patch repair protein)